MVQSLIILLMCLFFFFNDTATTEIYTLSLHDALPISPSSATRSRPMSSMPGSRRRARARCARSEEHTSELQSPCNLVCRLLLEKKKIEDHLSIDRRQILRFSSRQSLFSIREPDAEATILYFHDTATTEIYPLSLHDALPIWREHGA